MTWGFARPPLPPAGDKPLPIPGAFGFDSAEAGDSRAPGGPGGAYRAFTTRHDEIVHARNLCGALELARLRRMLDRQVRRAESVIEPLAEHLQGRLMAWLARNRAFNPEENLPPAAPPAGIAVPLPHLPRFGRERAMTCADIVVTLLLDNSGSMAGTPIELAAMSADIVARVLERCDIKTEILGFTTRSIDGGRSRKDWERAGMPARPGRLNDLRHIVYKSADEPWRLARRNLGVMLHAKLLKQNIDGEALLWAHARLLARPERRRILMAISDGMPMDGATMSANPGDYLEAHLRAVIGWIENVSDVELTAIGIGHDVTRFYRRAVTIADSERLAAVMMEQLAKMLGL
jgi:cobaltochelatase CobT